MRDPLPSIGMLLAFDAVMATGGFARAAERLNLTPAAISYQVRSLEKLLGSSLFERCADHVVPTTMAHDLAPEAGKLLKRMRRFREHGATFARRAKTVRVLAAQALASLWLMPHIADLIASFPDHRFEIMSWLGGTRLHRMDAEETELHIEMRWAKAEELPTKGRAALIAPDIAIPVCTPGYLGLGRHTSDPHIWRQLTVICPLNWTDIWDRWSVHAFGQTLDVGERIFFHNSALCVQAAFSGVGIAMAHLPLVAHDIAAGRLVAAHPAGLALAERYYAIDKSGVDLAFFEQFADWCRRHMVAPASSDSQGVTRANPIVTRQSPSVFTE